MFYFTITEYKNQKGPKQMQDTFLCYPSKMLEHWTSLVSSGMHK